AESPLILDVRSVSYASWAVVAGMGAGTVLSYSILAQYFPKEIAGRANAALNIFQIAGAFVLQEVIGWIINRLPAHGGHCPSDCLQGCACAYDCSAGYRHHLVRAVRSEAADIRSKSSPTMGFQSSDNCSQPYDSIGRGLRQWPTASRVTMATLSCCVP